MLSAESVSRRRGRASGVPMAPVPVRVRLMLRCIGCGRRRPDMEGETDGDVDMRSLSEGSSEALRLRFEAAMLCVV
jgi:hypothetical protein